MTTETNGKTTPTTALEIRSPIPSTIAYEPRNFDEAMRLAVTYAKSNLLGEVRSPEAALLVMACGADLGISPTAALRGIYIVKGRPFLSADLMVALCLRRTDLCEFFSCTEVNATSATYETKRKGAPVAKSTFTIDDARRAKLFCHLKASGVCGRTRDNGFETLRHEQLQAKQANRAGATHKNDIAKLHFRDFANSMDCGREGFAQ
jgi:hypothetical protein